MLSPKTIEPEFLRCDPAQGRELSTLQGPPLVHSAVLMLPLPPLTTLFGPASWTTVEWGDS